MTKLILYVIHVTGGFGVLAGTTSAEAASSGG